MKTTITLASGESRNVADLIPAASTDGNATVVNGTARLNGVESGFISWLNPGPPILVEAVTSCVVDVSDEPPPAPEVLP